MENAFICFQSVAKMSRESSKNSAVARCWQPSNPSPSAHVAKDQLVNLSNDDATKK